MKNVKLPFPVILALSLLALFIIMSSMGYCTGPTI